MFQTIKNWFSQKCTTKKNISIEEAKTLLLQLKNTNLVSLYSYPKYENETLVLVFDNTNTAIFESVQRAEIKNILKTIPFICLSTQEITEATDVFSLQFFDIQTTATHIYGTDIFKTITISPADLRRKIEFDIRNKSIYLRQESIRIPANILIHNIISELKPVIHGAEYLHIPLHSTVLEKIEEITQDIKKKKIQYSEKELLIAITNVSTMLYFLIY